MWFELEICTHEYDFNTQKWDWDTLIKTLHTVELDFKVHKCDMVLTQIIMLSTTWVYIYGLDREIIISTWKL
jgi:hypothetical protein